MGFQLVVVQGRSASQTLKVGAGVMTVGRQQECQLRINSSQVSRKHCQIFEKKGLLLVKDLGSSNGTLVNGKRIADQRVLEPGDELTVGSVKFRVERMEDTVLMPGQASGTPGLSKPADTAIAHPISGDDILELEGEDGEEETGTVTTTAKTIAAKKGASAPANVIDDDAIGIDEDDVADFLNIELDDEDKI